MQVLAAVEKFQHDILENLALVIKAIGPHIRQALLALTADLERLLEIRHGGAQGLDVALVDQLRDLLTAVRRVAAVGLGAVPGQGVLLGLRAREEGRGRREDARDLRARDAVVFQVDEAGLLEAAEEGVGGGLLFGGRAGEEEREVD